MWRKLRNTFNNHQYLTTPLFLIFGGGMTFYFFPFPFVPDYLNLQQYSKISELLGLIVSSLVSLIGIYVSVMIVAYELFKQRSGVDIRKSFFLNPVTAYYISFSVLTIIFSFLSSIIIPISQVTPPQVSILYFNILLFITVIVGLIPISFNLFSSLTPEKLANKELEKINRDSLFIRAAKKGEVDKQVKYFEDDSLLRIENIIIALIQVNDLLKAFSLVQKVTIKIAHIIISEKSRFDKWYLVDRFMSFLLRIVDSTLAKSNNSILINGIWSSTELLYFYLLEKQESSIHFERFRVGFFDRFFNRLFKYNNDEAIFEGLKCLRQIIETQVSKNMPKDEEIPFLDHIRSSIDKDYKYPDRSNEEYKNSSHFREVAVVLPNSFSYVINQAITLKRPEIVNKCFEEMQDLCSSIERDRLGVYKETYFLINSAQIISDYAYKAFEMNVFLEGSEAKNLTPILLEDLIVQNHPASRTILQKYCYLLINLQRIRKLDRWFLGGLTIGEFIEFQGQLGDVAWRCVVKYQNEHATQYCLSDCIDTYEILKKGFEKEPPSDFGLYLCIKSRLSNILKCMKERKTNAPEMIERLENLVSSFKQEHQQLTDDKLNKQTEP